MIRQKNREPLMETVKQSTSSLFSELASESGTIAWSELQRHFARGALLIVKPPLTVIDAAKAMIEDDSDQVGRWLNSGSLEKAKDCHARDWNSRHTIFEAIVVAPWVLVQADSKEPVIPEKS